MVRKFFITLLFSLLGFSALAQTIYIGRYLIQYERLNFSTGRSGLCSGRENYRFYINFLQHPSQVGGESSMGFNTSLNTHTFTANGAYRFRMRSHITHSPRIGSDNHSGWINSESRYYTKGEGPFILAHSHVWWRGECRRAIEAEYRVTVDDPVYIESIRFEESHGISSCSRERIRVETGRYFRSTNQQAASLQVQDRAGIWRNIVTNLNPAGHVVYITYDSIRNHVNLGQPIRFRTIKRLINGNYTIINGSTHLRHLPQLELAGDIVVIPPTCRGGSTTIKIPYRNHHNYVFTLGTTMGGKNFQIGGDNSDRITRTATHIVITDSISSGASILTVEDNRPNSMVCPAFIDFHVPYIPEFRINQIAYLDVITANDATYQIHNPGGLGRVSLPINNSKSSSVFVVVQERNTSTQILRQRASLSNRVPTDGIYYYSGTVVIHLPEGEFDVFVYNDVALDLQCTTDAVSVTLRAPAPIEFRYNYTSPTCNEQNLVSGVFDNGTIRLFDISGGAGELYYSVNNNSRTRLWSDTINVPELRAGDHVIVISDGYNNSTAKTITVSPPAPTNVEFLEINAPASRCAQDGSLRVNASGGCGNFSFSRTGYFLDFDTSNVVSGYSGNENAVYVRDYCGCVVRETFEFQFPYELAVDTIYTTPPSCYNGEDGSAVIIMKHVNGYLLVNNIHSDNIVSSGDTIRIFNLRAGRHRIEIEDDVECAVVTYIVVPATPKITIQTTVVEVGDKGSATGAIHVQVSGGNPGGYYVSLYEDSSFLQQVGTTIFTTDSLVFESLHGASGGMRYYIRAFDSKSCFGSAIAVVSEPQDTLRLSAEIIRLVSCFGSSDAEIELTGIDGWGGFQFSSDGENWTTNAVFSGFNADTHTFFVRDKWGGTTSAEITVTQPNPLTIERDSISHVSCRNGSDGLLRYRISGGTAPFEISPRVGRISETSINSYTFITIEGLMAGTHEFTVTDSRGCFATALTDTITEPEQLQISLLDTTHTTCELDNGILTVIALGGTAPFLFMLENVSLTYQQVQENIALGDTVRFYNLPATSYRIRLTDANGCSVESPLYTIDDYRNPLVSHTNIGHLSCFGYSDGRIEVIPSTFGTHPVVSFTMRNADSTFLESNTTGIFENLYADDYWIYVYDDNGCRSNIPFLARVTEPPIFAASVDTVIPVITKGERDGRVYFRVLGGADGRKTASLRNENGDVLETMYTVNNIRHHFRVYTGTFYLVISDNQGCTVTTEVFTVEEPEQPLRLIILEHEDARCKAQTGRIVVEGIGGWGDFRYRRITDGQFSTLNRFENLYPGSYVIEVTDRMGAIYRKTIVIHEPQENLQAEVVAIQAPACGNTGSVYIQISGGTAPYILYNGNDTTTHELPGTFLWQGFESGAQLFRLVDANGCQFELEVLIPETELLRIERFELTPPSISGYEDGQIRAIITGGVTPLTFEWQVDFGYVLSEQGELISNLWSGFYLLTVTDAAGCTTQDVVRLANPGEMEFEIIQIGHETSFEANNGFAILYSDIELTDFALVNPQHDILEYERQDISSQFEVRNDTIHLSNLQSGRWFVLGGNDYELVVGEFTINPFPEFLINRTVITPVADRGGATGSIRIEIAGGGGGNRFTWRNNLGEEIISHDEEFVSIIENLPAGFYTVTVEDIFGNQITQTIEVQEPMERLTISLVEKKNQDCKNDENAWVIVSASGGWGNYQFRHDSQVHFNNSAVFYNLPTRDNYFYLIDRMGVIDSIRISITEPDYLRASVAHIDSVACFGGNTGSILFEITGGTPPYRLKELSTELWIEGNLAVNLTTGWRTFIFTDSHNCTGMDTLIVYVPEPDELLFRTIEVTHTTCELDNGQIAVSLQGGTRPFVFSWLDFNNVEIGTDSVITNLRQNGVYRLYVTDTNGCMLSHYWLINPSRLPRVLQVETTEVLCYGGETGTAGVTEFVYGIPFAPYTFTWSNGDTGEFSNRFFAGIHSVVISDENGCSTTFYFEITQPDSLYLEFVNVSEPQCYGFGNGFIGTHTTGGRGEYSFLWSTGATTPYIQHLFKGHYWVEVSDDNGCMFRREIFLDEPEHKTVDLGADLHICPGNTVVIDGQDFVSHRWFTSQGDISNERFLSVNRQGHYFLEAIDENGCSVWGSIYVTVGNSALIAELLVTSHAFVGDTLFVVELSNMPLDSLHWIYDPQVFERVHIENQSLYVAHFRCLQVGIFNIGVRAYAQGCHSIAWKQAEVLDASERPDEEWKVSQPLIISLVQFPNPTDGNFTLQIELREEAEISLVLFEIATGFLMHQQTFSGQQGENQIEYNLPDLHTGVYTLLITVGNERRQVRIIIV